MTVAMATMNTLSFKTLILASLLWSPVHCAPWLITEAKQPVPVTVYGYDDYYEKTATTVTTSIEAIIPTATSLPEALSTVTQVNTLYDITAVAKLYPSGAGTAINYNNYYQNNYYGDSSDNSNSNSDHYTVFVVDLTYTAPSTGCSSTWTTTTAATLSAINPTLSALLPRTKVSTSLSVDTSIAFQPTTYTYDLVWVDKTQIPTPTLNSLSNANYPTSLYVGQDCYYHHIYTDYDPYSNSGSTLSSDPGTGPITGSGIYYGTQWQHDWFDRHLSILAIIIISVLVWEAVWFFAGILEAWIRFRRLMLGWQTRRGLPVCWCMTFFPLSLCCLWGFRKGYRARSAADAVILKERWGKMGFWRKVKLFLVWGFRFKYPTVLGPPPPRVKVSKRPEFLGEDVVNGFGTTQATGTGTQVTGMNAGGAGGAGEMEQTQNAPVQPLPRAFVPEASVGGGEGPGDGQGRARSC